MLVLALCYTSVSTAQADEQALSASAVRQVMHRMDKLVLSHAPNYLKAGDGLFDAGFHDASRSLMERGTAFVDTNDSVRITLYKQAALITVVLDDWAAGEAGLETFAQIFSNKAKTTPEVLSDHPIWKKIQANTPGPSHLNRILKASLAGQETTLILHAGEDQGMQILILFILPE